jgi:endo-alpha-1,4-polygalactosaminidase (GH114 family)
MHRWPASALIALTLAACGDSAPPQGGGGAGGEGGASSVDSSSSASSTIAATTSSSGGGEIWSPPPGTSWQWQLTGSIDTSFDVAMYDVELFDVPAETIAALVAMDRAVICYFSAGSYEDWRPDAGSFPEAAIGDPLPEWPGEWWLDVRSPEVRDILRARLDLAVQKGCTGVEPDNVDGYANQTGFDLDAADQSEFNRFLADEAHARGLSVGLKNTLDLVVELEPSFDWALNEECVAYDECASIQPFIAAGKAVFHVEYVDDPSEAEDKLAEACGAPGTSGFSTLVKTWDLDAFRAACGG